jgi:hypothetical protein
MSDGPYRSLNMRPAWKKVGKYAEKPAFEIERISDAIAGASCRDWEEERADELVASIRTIVEVGDLFADQKVLQLENLRRIATGQSLASIFLDCVSREVQLGTRADEAVSGAMQAALAIWIARHGRQMEEHYCREAGERRATDVRGRIERAIQQIGMKGLANQLLGSASQMTKIVKQSGLDDGVQL